MKMIRHYFTRLAGMARNFSAAGAGSTPITRPDHGTPEHEESMGSSFGDDASTQPPTHESLLGQDARLKGDPCARQRRSRETSEYSVGEEVIGRVCGIQDYGLFIRLRNGESGLVYRSEVCWPGEDIEYRLGDEVPVKVVGFKAGRGLSLSIRETRLQENFDEFIRKSPNGSVVTGTIKRVVDYGIFVCVAPGVDGLLHVSVMPDLKSYGRQHVGMPIKVKVSAIDLSARRIALEPVQ